MALVYGAQNSSKPSGTHLFLTKLTDQKDAYVRVYVWSKDSSWRIGSLARSHGLQPPGRMHLHRRSVGPFFRQQEHPGQVATGSVEHSFSLGWAGWAGRCAGLSLQHLVNAPELPFEFSSCRVASNDSHLNLPSHVITVYTELFRFPSCFRVSNPAVWATTRV